MTATNHALTGAVIGLLVGEPLLAVPAAVASHFVCDALPHYGHSTPTSRGRNVATKGFRNYLLSDAALCGALVLALAVAQPQHWQLAIICAFLAAAPDFGWINKFRTARQDKPWRPNRFSRFAANIQWFERPIGWTVEAAWLVAALAILAPFLR